MSLLPFTRPASPAPPRAAAPFPVLPSAASPGRIVLWAGGPAALRARAADHVEAVGARLVDAAEDTGTTTGGVIALGGIEELARLASRAPRRTDTMIALAEDGPLGEDAWRRGLGAGALAILRLPSESPALLDLLARCTREAARALVIGVAGGCGGAGTSETAARIAGAGVREGLDTTLVDADPWGGGLDVLVEAPETDLAHWEDIGAVGGDDGRALRDGLPRVDRVALLTARGAGLPEPAQTGAVLAALAPGEGLVVADLGAEHVTAAAPFLDALVLVVPASDHAVAAAARRLARWRVPRPLVRLVVRRRGPLTPRDVSEDLGLAVASAFRDAPPGAVPLLDRRRRGADASARAVVRTLLHERAAADGGAA
ncbi:CpaE-like family protein [Brachybacterium huguangmaarense]